MEPRLKWRVIILAAEIIFISFQTSRLKWNKIILAAKLITLELSEDIDIWNANNVTNLHHLTSHSTPCCPNLPHNNIAITDYCNITSPYVLCHHAIYVDNTIS